MTPDEVLKLIAALITGAGATFAVVVQSRKNREDGQAGFSKTLMEDRRDLIARLDHLQEEVDSLRSDIVSLRNDLFERDSRIRLLEQDKTRLTTENTQLVSRCEQLQGELRQSAALVDAARRLNRREEVPPVAKEKFYMQGAAPVSDDAKV